MRMFMDMTNEDEYYSRSKCSVTECFPKCWPGTGSSPKTAGSQSVNRADTSRAYGCRPIGRRVEAGCEKAACLREVPHQDGTRQYARNTSISERDSMARYPYERECSYAPRYLCSPVPMFPGTYVPRYLYSPVPMFPVTYVPRYLCSPVPMFPGTDVPRYLCSPVPMFPGTYVPRYLCSPVPMLPEPMFPSTYVPRYLCSPIWG